jgi:hypothetical protein
VRACRHDRLQGLQPGVVVNRTDVLDVPDPREEEYVI